MFRRKAVALVAALVMALGVGVAFAPKAEAAVVTARYSSSNWVVVSPLTHNGYTSVFFENTYNINNKIQAYTRYLGPAGKTLTIAWGGGETFWYVNDTGVHQFRSRWFLRLLVERR